MDELEQLTEGKRFAIVWGKHFSGIPKDLYIPPHALEVALDEFEGPLDLLLYLIRRDNLDISELAIAPITEQYMSYISMMEELDVDLAGEYLVMAAVLAEIKSRTLLPALGEEVEEEDPRAELIRKLKVYEKFKAASEKLDEMPRMERNWYETVVSSSRPAIPLASASVIDLQNAIKAITSRIKLAKAHLIGREKFSVSDRMTRALSLLKKERFILFNQLFSIGEGRSGVVVSLVAVLELAKNRMVSVLQNNDTDKIYLKRIGQGESLK